ncbi:MAG: fasciclin domain-containing protein [Bacteroidia bacterium]
MKLKHAFVVLLGLLVMHSCNNASENNEASSGSETELTGNNRGQAFIESDGFDKNVLEIAVSTEGFSTLVTAVQKAGVENALVNAGPLTVFAPNDDAFAKLPEGTVEELIKPENKATLTNILTHHVTPGKYTIKMLNKELDKGRSLGAAYGENLVITKEGDDLYVGGAKILATVEASNGIIHVVDNVIVPAE